MHKTNSVFPDRGIVIKIINSTVKTIYGVDNSKKLI